MRFIEFMPLDAEGNWDNEQVLSGQQIRAMLEEAIGPLVPVQVDDPSQPATDYAFADGVGRIGFINPVTQPFCQQLQSAAADGRGPGAQLPVLDRRMGRPGGAARRRLDEELAELVRASVGAKRAGHGINSDEFVKPLRAMYQIGG